MIKYRLKCNSCFKSYDSWYSSSFEYEKLRKKEYLTCHFCNSKDIGKTIMAPNLLSLNFKDENDIKNNKKTKKKNFGISEFY